ncbi:MAG: VanZ family protein [Sulfuricurvum sp.]|uniref:VanZ family protein n=1 Tax=Sulfuricurvum sp. TaxID=2025608 RepID=UPI0026111C1A|nr:VanZ family protein [Sulfuricurvum sp.]MDD2829707.1 VanZ family protein [Sulfuricurvum sp.]MDD4950149.1 VanZ family protein [Sulfuricurvum sp.]
METTLKSNTLKRVFYPASFFVLLLAIIYKADTANYNFAFHVVGMIPYGDKIAHAVLYGIMVYLLNYGFNGKQWFRIEIGSLIVFAFAFVEEVSQLYFPSRSFDWFDLLADVIGIVGAAVVYRKVKKHEKA